MKNGIDLHYEIDEKYRWSDKSTLNLIDAIVKDMYQEFIKVYESNGVDINTGVYTSIKLDMTDLSSLLHGNLDLNKLRYISNIRIIKDKFRHIMFMNNWNIRTLVIVPKDGGFVLSLDTCVDHYPSIKRLYYKIIERWVN